MGIKFGDLSGQEDGIDRGIRITQSSLNLEGVGYDSRFNSISDSDSDIVDDMNNVSVESQQRSQPNQTSAQTQLTHDFQFRSVHPSLDNDRDKTPFISTHHSMASCLVDYIFVSKNQTRKVRADQAKSSNAELSCLSYQRLPNAMEMDQIGLLPNECIGSDHLSMNAQFVIAPSD